MFDTQIQGVCGVRKLISYIPIIVSGTRYSEVCMMNRVSSASLGFIIFARDKKRYTKDSIDFIQFDSRE